MKTKKMKKSILLLAAIGLFISCANNKKSASEEINKLVKISETNNLPAAESVVLDKEKNILYVSCQAGDVPGDGSIARLTIEGEIIDTFFVSGLNNPKGIAILGDRLYVGDLLELVEIDRETGKVLAKYTDEKIQFLNDVTVDNAGNIYVSDMFISSIYMLDTAKNFTEWFSSPDMDNPNGLLAIGDEIYLAGWGKFTDGNPGEAPQGRFQKINIETKQITPITTQNVGNLDGIQVIDENSFFVSDWKGGKVFKIYKDGKTIEVLDVEQGSGDILYLVDKDLLIIPMKKQNQLLFYSTK